MHSVLVVGPVMNVPDTLKATGTLKREPANSTVCL